MARVNFPLEESNFCKGMDQNSQRFALWGAARNIFLVLKKEKRFS
jgi:hypothetical protein